MWKIRFVCFIFVILPLVILPDLSFSAENGQEKAVVDVAVGGSHTLAALKDGTVFAWGKNLSGQLGIGKEQGFKYYPSQVKEPNSETGFLSDVVAVDVGVDFSVVLKADGTVWTFGSNEYGNLGIGHFFHQPYPSQVRDPNDPTGYLIDITAISVGSSHVLALKKDRTVVAWGRNRSGTVGDGTTINRSFPVKVVLKDIVAVDAGSSHSIAVNSSGELFTWGSNENFQLGIKDISSSDVPIKVETFSNIKEAVAGGYYNLVLTNDQHVWAWGSNFTGGLGNGKSGLLDEVENQYIAKKVIDPNDPSGYLSNVKSIDAGGHSMAVKNDGTVLTWGWDSWGQLGLGNSIDELHGNSNQIEPLPSIVGGIEDPTIVSIGPRSSIAVDKPNHIWAWGANETFQLGDGSFISKSRPHKIQVGAAQFTDITDSYAHVAIKQLANSGVITGFSDGTFKPKATLTREQFAALIGRSLGIDLYSHFIYFDYLFTDNQDTSKWYFGYVNALKRQKVMLGVSDEVFGIGQPTTREAAVVSLIRALGLTDLLKKGEELTFNDSDQISTWARDSIALAYDLDIVQGYQNKFYPKQLLTREMIAQMLHNVNETVPQLGSFHSKTNEDGSITVMGSVMNADEVRVGINDKDYTKATLYPDGTYVYTFDQLLEEKNMVNLKVFKDGIMYIWEWD